MNHYNDNFTKYGTNNSILENIIVDIIKLEVYIILYFYSKKLPNKNYLTCVEKKYTPQHINGIIRHTTYFDNYFKKLNDTQIFVLFKKLYIRSLEYTNKTSEEDQYRLYLYKGDEGDIWDNYLYNYLNTYVKSTQPTIISLLKKKLGFTNKYLKYKMKYIALKKKLNL